MVGLYVGVLTPFCVPSVAKPPTAGQPLNYSCRNLPHSSPPQSSDVPHSGNATTQCNSTNHQPTLTSASSRNDHRFRYLELWSEAEIQTRKRCELPEAQAKARAKHSERQPSLSTDDCKIPGRHLETATNAASERKTT